MAGPIPVWDSIDSVMSGVMMVEDWPAWRHDVVGTEKDRLRTCMTSVIWICGTESACQMCASWGSQTCCHH